MTMVLDSLVDRMSVEHGRSLVRGTYNFGTGITVRAALLGKIEDGIRAAEETNKREKNGLDLHLRYFLS